MANGRCRIHGGANPGRVPTNGRSSKYAQVLGKRYLDAINDPDILDSKVEIALFDAFLQERIELFDEGFSSIWLDQVRSLLRLVEPLVELATEVGIEDAHALEAFDSLRELILKGGERIAAWEETLDKAKQRADLASKVLAAQGGEKVTENRMIVLFNRFLDILEDVSDRDTAAKFARRVDRELFGALPSGPQPALRSGPDDPA